jgi:hypothetical protein
MGPKVHSLRTSSGLASRRSFLEMLGIAAVGVGVLPKAFSQDSEDESFVFARLQYDGGDWHSDMKGRGVAGGSEINLLKRVNETTEVRAKVGEFAIRADDPAIAAYPFLYITGHMAFEFKDSEIHSLSRVLETGSFLFGDDCAGAGPFRKSFVREMGYILPGMEMKQLPMSHDLFQKPFKIDAILGGDKKIADYMEGIEIDGRLAVLYTDNDLGCAWEGHPTGNKQREQAFQLGINMVCYALSY